MAELSDLPPDVQAAVVEHLTEEEQTTFEWLKELARTRAATQIEAALIVDNLDALAKALAEAEGKLERVKRVGADYYRGGIGAVAYELRDAILGGGDE